MSNLMKVLQKRIDFICSDSWENRDAPIVRLGDDVRVSGAGNRLTGRLEVLLPKRNGEMVLFDARELDGIVSETDIDDLLADVLSLVLSKHNKWPR